MYYSFAIIYYLKITGANGYVSPYFGMGCGMHAYICNYIDVEGDTAFSWDLVADDHAEAIRVGLAMAEYLGACEAIEIFLGRVRVFSTNGPRKPRRCMASR